MPAAGPELRQLQTDYTSLSPSCMGLKPDAIRRLPSNARGGSPNCMRGSFVTFSIPASRVALSGHSSYERTTVSPCRAPAAAKKLAYSAWDRFVSPPWYELASGPDSSSQHSMTF